LKHRLLIAPFLALLISGSAPAQDLGSQNLQIHGFATQSFLASNHNNYLGMDTRKGTADWTEAAVNINDQVSDRFRVGIQFHYTRLGVFGGDTPTIDWALGDYSVNDKLGIRVGKVKLRWGLFNDTQDYDPGYLWSLLPESTYGIDWRTSNLASNGIELRGRFKLGAVGALNYNASYGYFHFAPNDGFNETIREQGFTFISMPGGKTPAVDLRWETPVRGLKAGVSAMAYAANGTTTVGTYNQRTAYWNTGYAEFSRGKLYAAAQYSRNLLFPGYNITGVGSYTFSVDNRAWFVMGAWRVTDKLQIGAYYDHQTYPSWGSTSLPANHNFDKVASARYDFNENFYLKVEGHFINGESSGLYTINNPNGLQSANNLATAKLGFTF